MTSSGDPRTGAESGNEPDWIDQLLDKAGKESAREVEAASIVPEPTQAPAPATQAAQPAAAAGSLADELADIKWVDAPDVTPASEPPVATAAAAASVETTVATDALSNADTVVATAAAAPKGLTADAVGRSAWDDELRDLDGDDPDGWDQLSWQDLDEDGTGKNREIRQTSTTGALIREWGPVVFAAMAIALFTRLVLVQAYHIPSPSMVPTLEKGDRVVVNRLSYTGGEIERGQVVVFEKPPLASGDNDLIKRVIGLPGEEIRIQDNQVYVNGLRVEEPYLRRQDSTRRQGPIPGCAQVTAQADLCVVPQGHIFMMGDNREMSNDSRSFGPVPIDTVVGRAFMKVWPLNDLGQL